MDQAKQDKKEGIYINGKGQIIEMLRVMPTEEKMRLLKNLSIRNSSLARELSEESFSFESFENFKAETIQSVLSYLTPETVGIALRGSNVGFQKKILGLMDRNHAETAYKFMTGPIENALKNVERARNRILTTVMELYKKNLVKIV